MSLANIVSEELAIFVSLDTRAAKLTRPWSVLLVRCFFCLVGEEGYIRNLGVR